MMSQIFPPTREEALSRLRAFVPRAGRAYAEHRNEDRGPTDRRNISMLSPYVRHRLLTEDEIISAVLEQHSMTDTEKFVQEVFWRTYWKGWLEHRPAVWQNYCDGVAADQAALAANKGLQIAWSQAISGQTGIDGFDDWATELVETGYLHNHARMWFASIWIFTLKLPWRLGAGFFQQHLLDFDPASNTLSWRWVAGLQTIGKTYVATADNIERYTQGRFRPQGLVRSAQPLSEPPPGAMRPLALPALPPQGNVALLLTEEDLCAETLELGRAEVAAVMAASLGDARGDKANTFVQGALRDASARAVGHFEAQVLTPETSIAQAIEESGLKILVTPYAAVGPVATGLNRLEPELGKRGIRLIRVLRDWDRQAWPYATKGFFALKEKIPKILAYQ